MRGRDSAVHHEHVPSVRIPLQTLGQLFRDDDLIALICTIFPEQSMRRGWTGAPNLIALDGPRRICEAAIWGCVYGGGVLYLHRPGDPATPADPASTITCLETWDRRTVDRELPSVGGYDAGQWLRAYPPRAPQGLFVHSSRYIVFGGVLTGQREREENAGWDDSMLHRIVRIVRDFNAGFAALGNMLTDASTGVLTISGVIDGVSSREGSKVLQARMALFDLLRSVNRTIFLDADGKETYRKEATTFAGVADVLDRLGQRLSAATNIPITRLLGVSPAGMNSTGESDQRNFENECVVFRRRDIEPAVARLAAITDPGNPPVWRPLHQPTDKEKAEVRKIDADTDSIHLQHAVIMPEDVARARYSAAGWTPIVVDTSLLETPDDDTSLKPPTTEKKLELTPSDLATVVSVNQALASVDLPPMPGPDGDLTISAYKAKYSSTLATASAAEAGEVLPSDGTQAPPV